MSRWRHVVALAALAGSAALSGHRLGAAADAGIEFEDAWLRVQRVSVNPGQSFAPQNRVDGVLISLTADLDGRMPRAEAVWQPASQPISNRAAARFEGVLVELKAPASGAPGPMLPELTTANARYYEYAERGDHTAVSLVDNDRVTVTRHRMAPLRWTERYHAHPRESVFVYLRGGQLTGASTMDGFHYARRGAFDVLPADFWHALYNGGNDPVEFVAIWPK